MAPRPARGAAARAPFPAAQLGERAVESRDRSIRDLAYHIYQIPDAFLQAVENGVDLTSIYNALARRRGLDRQDPRIRKTDREPARGAGGRPRRQVVPPDGEDLCEERPLHELLERCTWHSAQHARQIIAVLERLGIKADGPLTEADYAGLPLRRRGCGSRQREGEAGARQGVPRHGGRHDRGHGLRGHQDRPLSHASGQRPLPASDVAKLSGLKPRYVEEWLKGMVAAGYLDYDASRETYALPRHAYFLASEDTDHFVGGLFAMVPPLMRVAPDVARAFAEGGGVRFEDFGPECVEALELINGGQYEARFTDYWMKSVPRAAERLRAGGRALDVGCGSGACASHSPERSRRPRSSASIPTPNRSAGPRLQPEEPTSTSSG